MSEISIRRATVNDSAAVAALFDRYRRFYGQPSDLFAALQFITARLAANESVVILAANEQGVIGFTQLYPSFSSVSMQRMWILNDLFVAQEHRRKGVAQALMSAAEAFAAEDGSKGLALCTAKTNAAAKALYASRGWEQDLTFDHYERIF